MMLYVLNKQIKQCKSEGSDSCERPSNLTQIGFKSLIFVPCDPEIWRMTLKKHRANLLCYIALCASFRGHFIAIGEFKLGLQSENVQFWSKFPFFPVRPWNLTENNRAPLLCHTKLCASFHCHVWIQTGPMFRKRLIGFDLCDLDLWPLTLIIAWTSLLAMVITPKFHGDTMMGT